MIPMGFMAKRTDPPPGWPVPSQVRDVYSVGSCVNDDFEDEVESRKRNYWGFFDSPDVIQRVAQENSIDLLRTRLFYCEAHELEFYGGDWRRVSTGPVSPIAPHVVSPQQKQLEGYDVVTIEVDNSPEPVHSPLSCNGLARRLKANSHCLFDTFEEALRAVKAGQFNGCDPGALRIFAVFSVEWPSFPPIEGG
jgi:hypothetical protein